MANSPERRLPLWLKARLGEVHKVGRKRAARQSWELVAEAFGDASVETISREGGEILRVRLSLSHAGASGSDWGRIEKFREDLGLEVRASVEAQEGGQLQLLLDFSAAGFDVHGPRE